MPERKRDDCALLWDILTAIDKIQRYASDLDFDEFKGNDMVKDAIIRNFEIIGEAARHISEGMQAKYPSVEWEEMTSFRNVLIHGYFGLSDRTIWDTIQNNLPPLREHIAEVHRTDCVSA